MGVRIEMSRVWIPLAFLAFLLIFASAEENQNKFEDNGQDKEMDSALNGRENVAPSLTEEASLKRSFREPRKRKAQKGKKDRKNKGKNSSRKGLRGNKRPSKGGKNKDKGKKNSAIYKKMKNKKKGSRVAGRTKAMRVRENGY